MKSIRNSNEQGSAHLILLAIAGLVIVGAVGFLFWDNFLKPENAVQSSASTSVNNQQVEECQKRIRDQYIATHGSKWATEIDTSECSSDIVTYESLSDSEKSIGKHNTQIQDEAKEKNDPNICDQIKGKIYITYPANMTKVMVKSEDEAREICRNIASASKN